jgi:alpha-tubulin suppressor-like RCC1 family protein
VHRPGPVVALLDLPTGCIRKIAANGYTLGALTGKGDLYCWGCRPPGRQPFLNNLNGTPNLEDVYGKAIVDFGIGESHMIVLTDDDKVMVIGHNTNGQLGIPGLEKADTWTEVLLDLEGDKTVMAVRAGPRTSFLIVESGWKKDSSSDSGEESITEEDDGTHSVDNNFNREGGRSCRKRRFRGI